MKIYRTIEEIDFNSNTVLTIGTFDGLHLGHKQILTELKQESENAGARSFVITFDPHPRTIVGSGDIKLLNTLEEKLQRFEQAGVENVLIFNFNRAFSQIDYDTFIKSLIVDKIGVTKIIIGYDHKFGKNRAGNKFRLIELGKHYNFDVSVVDVVEKDGIVISSTTIRNLIDNGDVETAKNILGYDYEISGNVIDGIKRGRKIGFRTANIEVDYDKKLVPKIGVYVVKCIIDSNIYYGLMNIGTRPTFEDSNEIKIEVHLFDFNNDIYSEKIKIHFLKRLRDEIKFASKEELIEQIKKDKEEANKFLANLVN
ncbi:MAG: bifunctional riboflavin kinase/FAD synthetase [Melioribacteraceae bacterium]|nr:bifunctional riboflavin kinase/FAD synthetase [Melioribacteraceae bacterium]